MQFDQHQLNDYTKIFTAPAQQNNLLDLKNYLDQNREALFQQLHQLGILIFRGFKLENATQFHQIITEDLNLTPWNSFNPNLPSWAASLMRKYSENILGGGDYRRYLDRNTVQLGPVENSIQGPHIEGGVRSERSRYIALFCQEPSKHLAETGFNSLEYAWSNLSASNQAKYLSAWNHFSYTSARKLNRLDQILLRKSPFSLKMLENGRAKLTLQPSPLVIHHPETQKLVIQPWAFANNTNPIAYQAAQQSFDHRGEIQIDSTANQLQLNWEIYKTNGEKIEWSEADQLELFNVIYKNALLLQWQKGDFALVDNVKIAHWRMNGEQGQRKLIQIQANAFNADNYST